MKDQIETVVPRRKFVAGDNDEARKTATGHSCKPLCRMLKRHSTNEKLNFIDRLWSFAENEYQI